MKLLNLNYVILIIYLFTSNISAQAINTNEWKGIQALLKKDYSGALEIFEKTQGKNGHFNEILAYVARNHSKYNGIKPDYIHKVTALYLLKSDYKIKTIDGSEYTFKGSMTEKMIKESYIQQDLLKMIWETMSKGKFTVLFQRNAINYTVTKLQQHTKKKIFGKYRWMFDQENIPLNKMHQIVFENLDNTDTYIYYWIRGNKTPVWWSGRKARHTLIPFMLESPVRGEIRYALPIQEWEDTRVLFHEFWHVIEDIVKMGPGHAWYPENIKNAHKLFPDWKGYSSKEIFKREWSYYIYQTQNHLPKLLRNVGKKQNSDKVLYKNLNYRLKYKNQITNREFELLSKAISPIPHKNLQAADKIYKETMSLKKPFSEKAYQLYLKALNLNPFHKNILFNSAQYHMKKNEYQEANNYYSRIIAIFPNNANAFAGRADSFRKMEKYELALKDCNKAILSDEDYPWSYFYRAWIHSALNQHEEAIMDIDKLMELGQKSYIQYRDKGTIYKHWGIEKHDLRILQKAVRSYEKALKMNPDDKWTKKFLKQTKNIIDNFSK